MTMKNKQVLQVLAQRYDSFYLYDEGVIREQTGRLKEQFPGVGFLYSVKCNPHPRILRCVFAQGFGADAASLGEAVLARDAGLPPEQIYYSAPGKTRRDIAGAIGCATLIADSIGEIRLIQSEAEKLGRRVNIGIRINPDFSFTGDAGLPSKFGIDEDQALEFLRSGSCPNVKINGIHVHLKSQELCADVLAGYYRRMLRLAEKFDTACAGLDYVNMGSGMGVSYSEGEAELDLSALGSAMERELAAYRENHPETRILIEVGRFAVCKAGVYVTKVVDRKVSRGKTYLILKNTLNGFLRPSLARLVMHYAAQATPGGMEPLFTGADAFRFLTLKEDAPSERVTLVGNLCTAADVVAEDICLAHLEPGDMVVITNAGSYAAVLSPMQFSSQEAPAQLFLSTDGKIL